MSQPFKHGHLPKNIFLSDRLVFINQVENSTLYKPETALTYHDHLCAHDHLEMDPDTFRGGFGSLSCAV